MLENYNMASDANQKCKTIWEVCQLKEKLKDDTEITKVIMRMDKWSEEGTQRKIWESSSSGMKIFVIKKVEENMMKR